MSQLAQAPFLQALGYALINSLWQFALLWLMYVSIHTFLKISSHQKYSAGVLIQAAGFGWFAATFCFYLHRFSLLQKTYLQHKNVSFASVENSTVTVNEKFFALIDQAKDILPYLAFVYLLVLLLLCFQWMATYKRTKFIKTKGLQKIEVNWRLFVKEISVQLGIKREVKIYLSETVQTPLTIGFLKPFILIPLASINQLTTDQMEAVILHELAHIKRFDYIFNLFLALIEIILFFNPFMLLISRYIKRERENCCDDWVLQYQYNPASYARALLQIAACQSSSLLALGAADNKKILLHRIKRMIEKKEKTLFNYRYQLIAFFIILTVLGSLAVLSARQPANNAAVAPLPAQLIAKPMIEIVNSSLYNPDFDAAPLPKKAIPDEKRAPAKTAKKNISYKSTLRIAFHNTHKNNSRQQDNSAIAEEVNRVPFNQNALFAADEEKNFDAANTALDEAEFPAAALKEQEVSLAENHLKELAKYLFEANKTLIDQKQVAAEIRVVFEQLKTIKIQLNATARVNSPGIVKNNAVIKLNGLRSRPGFASCSLYKLRAATKELQIQTEKALKQNNKESERNHRYYYNYNLRIPEVMYNVPEQEKLHSFSFEYSAEPKIQVDGLHSFYTLKRDKKINKTSAEKNEKNLNFQKRLPFISDKSSTKASAENDNFFIIHI